jgi:hypothetical protein
VVVVETKDLQETQEPKVRKDQPHLQVLRETKDQKDRRVRKVLKETHRLETKVGKDLEVLQVLRVMRRRVLQDHQVTRHLDLQVLRVRQVQVVIRVQQLLQDLKALREQKEIKVSKDQ